MDKYMHNQIFDHVSEITLFLLLPGLIAPPTAEVEQSFIIMKLVDTPPPLPQCHLSQENHAHCMCICKFEELLGRDYQAVFQRWMDAKSTKSGQHKAASCLEYN